MNRAKVHVQGNRTAALLDRIERPPPTPLTPDRGIPRRILHPETGEVPCDLLPNFLDGIETTGVTESCKSSRFASASGKDTL